MMSHTDNNFVSERFKEFCINRHARRHSKNHEQHAQHNNSNNNNDNDYNNNNYCARAQPINQHVDAGQLNVPP